MATSAQDLIRALKAPSDPPQSGGPHKIQIAREAWDNGSLYLPSKGETVAEWILTRLLKDKEKAGDSNPILDTRYWSLLKDILLPSKARTGSSSSRLKSWVPSLISRVPIIPIATAFGVICVSRVATLSSRLTSEASDCLAALFPHAVGRSSSDALLECFGAFLAVTSSPLANQPGIPELISLVTSAYRSSFNNSTHKKKLYSLFLKNHLQQWLECIRSSSMGSRPSLLGEIYDAGVDTIFDVESIRLFSQDSITEGGLEEELTKLMRSRTENTLSCLPRLFSTFIAFSRKHRVFLIRQIPNLEGGPKADQSQESAMKFFTTCERLLGQAPEGSQVWRTRVALLSIVDSENVFNMGDGDSRKVLIQIGELAVQQLAVQPQGDEDVLNLTFEALSTLTHVDYELVANPLNRVVPILASVPSTNATRAYLGHLFDYHTKTRTINGLAHSILLSFGNLLSHSMKDDPSELYNVTSSSSLQDQAFLEIFSRSIHAFLTPGQILDAAESVIQHVQSIWADFRESVALASANHDHRSRKKQKREGRSPTIKADPGCLASVFAGTARIGASILTSLPLHILPDGARGKVQEVLREFCSATISSLVKKTLRELSNEDRTDTWGWQIVALSALRLRYHLFSGFQLLLSPQAESKFVPRLVSVARFEQTLPELRVEIVRTLLFEASEDLCEPSVAFDEALRILDGYGPSRGSDWSGRLHDLNTHPDSSFTAVFHLILTRWLPMLDAAATPEQLRMLAKVMIQSGFSTSLGSLRNMGSVFHRVLRDAQFWEMNRLTGSLLSQVTETLCVLDDVDPIEVLQHYKGKIIQEAQEPLDARIIGVAYAILLHTPPEAIPRSIRADLLRRAIAADAKLGCSLVDSETARALSMIREFMQRTLKHAGSEQLLPLQYVDYLVDHGIYHSQERSVLSATTMDLLKHYFSTLVSVAARGGEGQSRTVVQSFITSRALNIPVQQVSKDDGDLRFQSLVCLIDVLTSDRQRSEFAEETLQRFKELYERLVDTLLPRATSYSFHGSSNIEIGDEDCTLSAWHRVLMLRRWLALDGPTPPQLGRALVGKLSSFHGVGSDLTYTTVLSIVLEELHTCPADRTTHLTFIIATYVLFSHRIGNSRTQCLNSCMSKATKALTIADFSSVLDLVFEGLSHSGLAEDRLPALVHFSGILIHHAPEGTLRLTQAHLTQCLALYIDHPVFLANASLRACILRLTATHVNDRPATIRMLDVSHLWSLLGHVLVGSNEHEPNTDRSVYQNIVSILNALVRLRRDLILPCLPHLGIMMRRLLTFLKTPPPQLGKKQSRLVASTLPSWVNPNDPLGAEESKAVARLFTTLTTKTIIRIHGIPSELQKAESLARPFSKHASVVLMAYVDALNDPLCIMPSETRRELQPGLFAICEIMGEQNRDAMMVTLDSSGKTIMKSLWREYEKQRYTGKG